MTHCNRDSIRFPRCIGIVRNAALSESAAPWTEAAQLPGVCERTFRRYLARLREEEGDGIEALRDRRLSRASHRAAPVDEVMRMVDRYRTRHAGWNVRHFYAWYRRDGGQRSYNWVRTKLQEAGAVPRGRGRGKHRKRREPSPCRGMLLHQDGSTREWVPGRKKACGAVSRACGRSLKARGCAVRCTLIGPRITG